MFMDRLSFKNSDVKTRGKTVRTLIRELVSFSNFDAQIKTLWEEEEMNNLSPKPITNILLEDNYYLLINNNTNSPITIRTFLKYFLDVQDFDIEVRFSVENQNNIGIGLVGNMNGDCVLFSSE